MVGKNILCRHFRSEKKMIFRARSERISRDYFVILISRSYLCQAYLKHHLQSQEVPYSILTVMPSQVAEVVCKSIIVTETVAEALAHFQYRENFL